MRVFLIAAGLAIAAGTAGADEPVTVQSLLTEGYALTATMASQIGPGLFFQKGDRLFLCFVIEKPDTKDLTTRYCKPVH